MTLRLQTIPLNAIHFDPRNPRTNGEETLEELAASIHNKDDVVQPPTVTPTPDGFRALVGERRVRAARLAGLQEIPCLVRDVSDGLQAHRLRVVENLHRRELNPIDQAAALRVSWLAANALALGLQPQVESILGQEVPLLEILPQIESLLSEHNFSPTAPAVTWESVLDDLGVEMTPSRRKRLLRVLSIPQDVQHVLRQTPVTEAAMRALGTLDETAQRQVADAIGEDHTLARRARRIARAVRDQGYSVEEALAEARGEFQADIPASETAGDASEALSFESDQAAADAVLQFVEAVNAVLFALSAVRKAAPDTLDIPQPWRGYFLDAIEMLQSEL